MNKFFKIDGFFKDDNSTFCGMIIKDFEDVEETRDDEIFFYGLSEAEIVEAIAKPEESSLEFTITSYEEVDF